MADPGHIRTTFDDAHAGAVARVTLVNPRKLNVMTRAMWRQLRQAFTSLARRADLRCVVVSGEGGHFCAGGDIAEYPDFRFEPATLRDFHEDDVWGALSAMLACDVPLMAAIDGHCMGGGMEIASCCDIRVAAEQTQFGAPIARLGFPMAPRELQLVARVAGELTVREMLLEAAVFDADEMKARGFLSRVVQRAELLAHVSTRADRIARLAPQAARMTKRTLRELLVGAEPGCAPAMARSGAQVIDSIVQGAYDYAGGAEHREGVQAFLEKRPPCFPPALN